METAALDGLAMARVNRAREDIVELFVFLHDSQRLHDGTDREHGARATDYTLELYREVLLLDPSGLEMPTYSVPHHGDGPLEAGITVKPAGMRIGSIAVAWVKAPRVEILCTDDSRDPVLRGLA